MPKKKLRHMTPLETPKVKNIKKKSKEPPVDADIYSYMDIIEKKTNKTLEGIENKVDLCLEKVLEDITKTLTKINNMIKQTKVEHENTKKAVVEVDDNLRNVLLAIRQNEYLQAWYPEQAGFPEMKVVGKHPSKLK